MFVKTASSFLPLIVQSKRVSTCGRAHALNYAPMNYEWHGIMKIINGVRFADTNEEPARRGLLHVLMRISCRQEFSHRAARCTYNKVVFRNYCRRPCLLLRVANSHAMPAMPVRSCG